MKTRHGDSNSTPRMRRGACPMRPPCAPRPTFLAVLAVLLLKLSACSSTGEVRRETHAPQRRRLGRSTAGALSTETLRVLNLTFPNYSERLVRVSKEDYAYNSTRCRRFREGLERSRKEDLLMYHHKPTLLPPQEGVSTSGDIDVGPACKACQQLIELTFLHIPHNAGATLEGGCFGREGKPRVYRSQYNNRTHPQQQVSCSHHHVPPRYRLYETPEAKFFCVIRDPVDRLLSEYKFIKRGSLSANSPLDVEAVSKWILGTIHSPYSIVHNDCHMLPQVLYVFDAEGRRRCKDVLVLGRSFAQDFDEYVKEKGCNNTVVRLENFPVQMHHVNATFRAHEHLPEDVVRRVRAFYWEDSCLLDWGAQ